MILHQTQYQSLEITLCADRSLPPSENGMWPAGNPCHVTVSSVECKSQVHRWDCGIHGNPMSRDFHMKHAVPGSRCYLVP